MSAKKYACGLLGDYLYGVYALTLNKRRVFAYLAENKATIGAGFAVL